MAHATGFGPIRVQISVDGEHWTEIGKGCIIGPIFVYRDDIDDLEEIAPDNPLYAELVEILEATER